MKHGLPLLAAVVVALAPNAASAADVPAPSYLPPPAATKYAPPPPPPPPCYAIFHGFHNAQGPSLTRFGPEQVARIRLLRFPDGHSLNGRVLSVTTGPGAQIELFNGRYFRRFMMSFGPARTVNLRRPKVDSYRISCLVPASAY